MKDESKPKRWRLGRTLRRRVEVRAMEPDDLKYLWAAYRKGALAELAPEFVLPDLSAEQFREAFDAVAERFSEAWVISAETRKGFMPAGVMFGNLAPMAAYLIITGAVWFPWATRRNIIEGTVAFLNPLRKETPAMFYALDHHKRLYEVVCMHGILRRVGTSFAVFPGKSAAVFETRA